MGPLKIAIYDFDGTLFRSPEKPLDWEGSWWGNIESLTSPVVPTTPGEEWWNLPVVERAKRDIANPEVLTALVTGRLASKFHVRVQDLLAQVGLKFDHVFFSPGGDTEAYKLDVIGQLLRDNYSARGVDIWEDRGEHLRKYADYVEAQGRAAFPHLITTSAHTPDVLRVARKFAAQERSIGLFLPLPKDLASQFPSLGEKDDSPTHCTLLILGNVDPEDDDHLLATLMENLRKWPTPITATLKGLNYFDNQGTVVAYDRVRFNTDVARLRSDLVAVLMDKGFSIDDVSPQNYYPHVTLEYMPPGSFGEYKGTVPQGSWEFDTVELWGMEDTPIEMPLGDKVRPQRVAACLPERGVLIEGHGFYCPEGAFVGPACPGGAKWDDGRDAWTCPSTGWVGENGPVSEDDGTGLGCGTGSVPVNGTCPALKLAARVAARYKKKTKDSEGNVHYEYSERQVANRHREKAERVEHLRQNISDLRARVKGDLTDEDPATRMIALVVALMDETCERVGNDESAEEGHFGVTGWQVKHVTFKGDTAVLKYVGKSGVKHEKVVETGPVVTALKKLTKGRKGEDCLFETDEATVGADDVNDYLAEFDITAKDIRGFRANDEMLKALKAERSKGPKDLPRDRKEKDKILKAEFKRALEVAAEAVGHEAATLRSQYLVPDLEESYVHDGTILKALKVGTKTESEREDEEIEGLVKPLPKKKPPRHDLRKERLYTDDPDLDMTDDDLSMNYKKVASSALLRMSAVRVASRWLAAGEDDSSEEFQKYIKGETFPNPDPDTKDKHPEVSYSTLKEKSPEAAKKVYQDWAAKQKGKEDEVQEDVEKDEPGETQTKPEGKAKPEDSEKSPAPSDLRDKIREGLKDVQGLSEDAGEELDDLFTSVMGESSSKKFVQDLQKATIEQAKALLNEGAKALSTGDTYDLGRLFSKMEDGVYDVGKDKGKLEDFSLEASEKRIQSVTGKRDGLQGDIKKAQDTLKSSKSYIDKELKKLGHAEEELPKLQGDLESAEKSLETFQKRVDKLKSKQEDGKDLSDEQSKELAEAERDLSEHSSRLSAIRKEVSSTERAIEEAQGNIDEKEAEVEEAENIVKEKQPQLDQYNEALVRMTAFHASKAYLVSKMSDPSEGSLDPDERANSLADNLDDIPKEVLDARKSRGTKEIKKLNKSMKSLDEAGKAEAKKKIDALEAEQMVFKYNDIASGTDEPKDTATRFIREFKDYGIENEHVRTLLVHGTRTEEGRAALWNLAKDLDTDALIELAGPAGKGFEGATKDDDGNPINSRGHAAIRQAILSRMMLQEARDEDGWDPEGVEKQIDALTNATKGMKGFSKNKNVQKWLWNTGDEVKKLLDKGGVKVKKSIQNKVRDAFPEISKETPEEWGDRMMEKSDKAEKRDEDESKKRQKKLEQQAEKQMRELERKSDKAEKEREKAEKKRETSKGKKTGHVPSSATIAARFLGYAGAGR